MAYPRNEHEAEILERIERGEKVSDVARVTGVSRQTVYTTLRRHGVKGFQAKEITRMKKDARGLLKVGLAFANGSESRDKFLGEMALFEERWL